VEKMSFEPGVEESGTAKRPERILLISLSFLLVFS